MRTFGCRGVSCAAVLLAVSTLAAFSAFTERAHAEGASRAPMVPHAADVLRVLGPHAASALAPNSGQVGALVAVPPGTTAEALGLDPVAPGIGRLRGSPDKVLSFADAHSSLHMEVAPPLHLLLDRVGTVVSLSFARNYYNVEGDNVVIGVADTGLDVGHPDFLDADKKSRVAWMLDLSLAPLGKYPDLEAKYGLRDDKGNLVAGAVFDNDDLNALLPTEHAPQDGVGHGTHVASIAAGGGGNSFYVGMAPKAKLVIARVTRSTSETIEDDDLLRGAQFIFDRADFMKLPAVANFSLGSDFGPHDGSMLWEQTLASYVGADKPGHVLVAAAGNSGSLDTAPTHQSVRVSKGTRMQVPIDTSGATDGSVQVWITLRSKGKMAIGLDAPDGTWIPPVEEGSKQGKNTSDYNAGVIFGSGLADSPIPAGSRGAAVVWSGKWPAGRYSITLEGDGYADLYLQALKDAAYRPASFVAGVREGTINLPATHPSILAVGCTASRPSWTSIAKQQSGIVVPVLDSAGGYPTGDVRELGQGDVCWFSSAGPNADGVPKPEIMAPGAAIVAAMSRQAAPGNASSIFSTSNCPAQPGTDNRDPRCLQVDDHHAVSIGTSMSAPVVAGGAALLLERDPTLTQEKVIALMQAGAHRIRGEAPFNDQAGPGELDIYGALEALTQLQQNGAALPDYAQSWLTLSSDYALADGSRPIVAILELRATSGLTKPDLFDTSRLRPLVMIDGVPIAVSDTPTIRRHGPGLYSYSYSVPAGTGGSVLTMGATFDGGQIVAPKKVSISTDPWVARYPTHAAGGCGLSTGYQEARDVRRGGWAVALLAALGITMRRRTMRRRRAAHAER